MGTLLRCEPVALINALVRLVGTLVTLFVVFGLDWSQEQQAAIVAGAAAIGAVLQTMLARGQVAPVAKMQELERKARETASG